MAFVRWLAGGLIGGLIGAAIWAAIGYATQYEIGWIAWGVGFLVGMGVRIAAPDTDGPVPGDEEVPLQDRYPKEVWAEATKRWNALPPDQKEQQTKARGEQVKESDE